MDYFKVRKIVKEYQKRIPDFNNRVYNELQGIELICIKEHDEWLTYNKKYKMDYIVVEEDNNMFGWVTLDNGINVGLPILYYFEDITKFLT